MAKFGHHFRPLIQYKSSSSQMLFKINVLKCFTSFKEKHLCRILILIKLQA